MNEREALLRAVCANPDDDTPRLVFADWLQENGDESDQARAEFIRVQILMALTEEHATENWPAWQRLCAQEQELRLAHDEKWWAELPDAPGYRLGRIFTRGFIPWVTVTKWETFVRDIDVILNTSPVVNASFACALDAIQPKTIAALARFRNLDLTRSSESFTADDWLALLHAPLPKLRTLSLAKPSGEFRRFNWMLEKQFGERLRFDGARR